MTILPLQEGIEIPSSAPVYLVIILDDSRPARDPLQVVQSSCIAHLILNCLKTNSLKYAFPSDTSPLLAFKTNPF